MDYTIIGAETNLAARLESIAEPGQIILAYETYTCVRDIVATRALPPIRMKGISREVVPYLVEGVVDATGAKNPIFSAHMDGLEFHLDPSAIHPVAAARIRGILREAMTALEKRELRQS